MAANPRNIGAPLTAPIAPAITAEYGDTPTADQAAAITAEYGDTPTSDPSPATTGVSDPSHNEAASVGRDYNGVVAQNDSDGPGRDQEDSSDASDSSDNSDGSDGSDGSGDSGGDSDAPVILDLTGHGIKITPLTSSNNFVKLADDGYAHRTAWAGAGNAVLFYDPSNSGQISQANQVVFTAWDPTATSDMQALRDVFDTNHDGLLDAGDAGFASFKLMVTNADGTTSVQTLAQAGITSINLVPQQANVQQVDGSTVTGQTIFTRTNGTTGTAADVTLAYDDHGYVVKTTVTHNPDGSTTVDNKSFNAAGDLASETTSSVSANGLSRTLTFDSNGDGTVDGKETDVTVTNGDGSTTETLSDFGHGGTSLIDRFATTTSADGKTITITRDFNGGGIAQQTETRVTAGDGSSTNTLSNVNQDGSLISKSAVSINASGLTKTTQNDHAGSGSYDLTTTDATVVNGDNSRTETIQDTSLNGTLIDKTITTTSANGQIKTIQEDHAGAGTTDLTIASTTVTNGDSSNTTTVNETNGDGSLRGKLITTYSADTLVKTVQADLTGDGVIDRKTTDTTTIDGTGTRTKTVASTSANGTQLAKTVTVENTDGISRTVTVDANGDGSTDAKQTVTVDGTGNVTDTEQQLAPNGSTVGKSVTTTTANGLGKTVQLDHTGIGNFDLTVADTKVVNGGGGSTETVTATNNNGSLRGQSITTISADNLTTTVKTDADGNGTFDRIATDAKVNNGDNSRVETMTTYAGNATTLLAKTVMSTSADRRTISITTDATGDGATTRLEAVSVANNGTTTDTISNLNQDGSLISKMVMTAAANGLNTTTQVDQAGSGSFNLTTTDVTTINNNASRTEVVSNTNNDGSLRDTTLTKTSGNGLSVTTVHDFDGNGTTDLTAIDAKTLNQDGSTTEAVTDTVNTGALRDKTVTTTSGTGLSRTTTHDFDGDGTTDLTTSDTEVLNADGSTVETVTDSNIHGLRDQSVTTNSADHKTVTTQRQFNGSVTFSQTEAATTATDGSITDALSIVSAGGTLIRKTATTTAANGLSKTVQADVNGDGTLDTTASDVIALNTDGSRTETITHTGTGGTLIDKTVTTTSGNGLSITTQTDQNGDSTFDLTKSDITALGNDGSTTRTVLRSNADGSLRTRAVTVTSADRKTVAVTRTFGQDGTQADTSVIQANGTILETLSDKNAAGTVIGGKTVSTTANGLSRTTTFTNAAGVTTDTATDTTTLNTNGGRTEHYTDQDGSASSDMTLTTSANGLVKTSTLKLNGSTSYAGSDTTTLNADGSDTEVIADTIGGAVADKLTITLNADALTKTFALDENNDGTADITDTSATATDGSKTETLVALNTATGAQQQKDVITTSTDGRTTSLQSARNGDTAFDHFETTVINPDGSISDADFVTNPTNAPNYKQTRLQVFTPEGGQSVTVTDFSRNMVQDITVTTVSANGLSTTAATQTNGAGAADLTRTDVTVLNADGSRTETIKAVGSAGSGNANGGVIYKQVITTSADGKTVTTQVDNDGNGIFENKTVAVTASDGSQTQTLTKANNVSGAAVTFKTADGGLASSTVETVSANGLVKTDIQGTLTNTMTLFADANGSYQWVESSSVTGVVASATHAVDAAKVDSWTYRLGTGQSQTIRLDLASEARAITQAEGIYQAVLGRAMQDGEVQALGSFITGGVLNQATLTTSLLGSTEFTQNFGGLGTSELVRAGENLFGRLPSYTDIATDLSQISAGTMTMAAAIDALVQKAQDQAAGNGLLQLLANSPLVTVTPVSLLPANDQAMVATGTAYESFVASFPAPNGALTQAQISSFETLMFASTNGITTQQGTNLLTASLGGTTDEIFYGTANTIDAQASGFAKLVDVSTTNTTSSFNTLKAGSGTGIILAGSTYDVLLGGSGSSSLEALGNNEQVTTGTGTNSVYVQGSGVAVNASAGTSTIAIAGANATVTGATSSSSIDVAGTGETVTGNGSSMTVESGATATIAGSNNIISSASSAGINLTASSSTLTASGPATMTVAGANDTVNADSGSKVTVTGTGTTLTLANGTVLMSAGASAALKGSGNIVLQQGSTILTATGESNAIDITGTGVTDTASLALITLEANAAATVNGSRNQVVLLNGASLTDNGSTDMIDIGQPGSATLSGTNESVVMGAGTVTVFDNEVASINGTGATINLRTGVTLTLTGTGNTAYLVGNSSQVTDNGSGNTIKAQGSGEAVTMSAGSLEWSGSGGTLTGNNDAIQVDGGITLTVNGSSDTATTAGANATLTISGTSDAVNVASTGAAVSINAGTVQFASNATGTVTGNNNSATITGTNANLTMSGSGDSATVSSTGATVALSSGTIVFASGSAGTVTGSNDAVQLNGSNTATISGNGNTITFVGAAALTTSGATDKLIFQASPQTSTFTGYDTSDTFQFSKSTFADWSHFLAASSQQGANTVIHQDATHTITLNNVTLSSLNQSHFSFV